MLDVANHVLKLALLGSAVITGTALCQVPLHFQSYTNGLTAYHRGEIGSATKLLEQAVVDLPPLQVSLALTALGEVYREIGDVKLADRLMRESNRVGLASPIVYARLADYYLQDNRPKDAIQLCKAAFLNSYRGASRAIIEAVYGEALFALNRIQEGETAMAKALGALAADPNRHPWEFGWALVRSARIADARGDFKRAITQSEEAFKFAEPRWGAWSPLALAALDVYGSSLAKNGDAVKGRAVLEGVLKLRREVFLESSPAVLATKVRLESIAAP